MSRTQSHSVEMAPTASKVEAAEVVFGNLRRHGSLARACREANGGTDQGRILEQRVRRLAKRDAAFASRLAAARAAGRSA